jgi:hypothetical protein
LKVLKAIFFDEDAMFLTSCTISRLCSVRVSAKRRCPSLQPIQYEGEFVVTFEPSRRSLAMVRTWEVSISRRTTGLAYGSDAKRAVPARLRPAVFLTID